jgi:DNA-directed RNA polymerase omega subunit
MNRSDIPPHEELMYKIKNKYQFILAVAKRARMLVDGAPSVKEVAGVKPTTKALGELLGGHIKFGLREDESK